MIEIGCIYYSKEDSGDLIYRNNLLIGISSDKLKVIDVQDENQIKIMCRYIYCSSVSTQRRYFEKII